MITQKFAFSHFCDDIRQEVGNKISLMGMYSGVLQVEAFPAAIQKLACASSLIMSRRALPETVVARLYLNEQLLAEQAIPEGQVQILASNHPSDEVEKEDRLFISFYFLIAPLMFSEAGALKAVITVDGEEMPSGKLRVIAVGSTPQTDTSSA